MVEVKAISDWNTVKTMDKAEAEKAGLFEVIGKEVDDAYMAELKKQVIHMDAIQAEGKNLKIVYTPLHGTGNIPARRILKELGFENVYVVKEQELPDSECLLVHTTAVLNYQTRKPVILPYSLFPRKYG